MHYVGLDLGQSTDYTALCVVERVVLPVDPSQRVLTEEQRSTLEFMFEGIAPIPRVETKTLYHIRHLERLTLGTPYPAIVEHVSRLVRLPALRGARLVVDATGVGAPVIDLLAAAQLPCALFAIHITGGDAVSHAGMHWRVPKRDLVGATQILFQNRRLKIVRSLPEAQTLVNELLNFRMQVDPVTIHDTYDARQGQHDDLLLAACMALWLAEKLGDGPQIRAL